MKEFSRKKIKIDRKNILHKQFDVLEFYVLNKFNTDNISRYNAENHTSWGAIFNHQLLLQERHVIHVLLSELLAEYGKAIDATCRSSRWRYTSKNEVYLSPIYNR